MRLSRVLVSLPVWLVVIAASNALPALADNPPPATPTPSASPSPSPSPSVPVNAFLSLDVTSGPASTVINVTGGQFLANEQMSLYWDVPNHIAGGATADSNGNFNVRVKPFAGDQPGLHKLYASVPPNPSADFTLMAPTPTPSPSPTPTESPSPSPSPTEISSPTASPTPVAATLNGFDVISRPPFVFLPIIGLLAIALSLGYWVLSVVRRPRQASFPAAAVVHRAMRPDYSAGFGTPPPAPAPPTSDPSAWADVPHAPPAAPELGPPAPTWDADANAVAWGTGEPDTGYQFPPPELLPDSEE